MKDSMKIIESLKESGSLIIGAHEAVENEEKEQKIGFLGVLVGTLGATLLRNLLARKEARATGQVRIVYTTGKRKTSQGQDF